MSPLAEAVSEYLSVRRAMGHKLERAEELLGQFMAHLDAIGVTAVTVDEAVAWASKPIGVSRAWMCIRLGVVRCFATWLQARDPFTQVPRRTRSARGESAAPSLTSTRTRRSWRSWIPPAGSAAGCSATRSPL